MDKLRIIFNIVMKIRKKNGMYYFVLQLIGGKVLMSSEDYSTRARMMTDINMLSVEIKNSQVINQIDVN